VATRILGVATALLLALVVHQYTTLGNMRTALDNADARAYARARSRMASSLGITPAEIADTISWLNRYYQSPAGLDRPGGLWIDGHPDYQGISAWVFDLYLRERLGGKTEDEARRIVAAAIEKTGEWQAKHGAKP
jgi:hypothetical protein